MAGLIEWASIGGRRHDVVRVDLQHGDGARRLAHGQGVDEDEGVVAVEQLVGEVHAADAVLAEAHAVGRAVVPARRSATSTPKPSSPKKTLPMPAARTFTAAPPRPGRSSSSGPARRAARSRVVVEGDGDVVVAVDVVEHAGHGGVLAGEEHVVGVGPPRRAQHHLGAPADDPARHRRRVSANGSTAPSMPGSHHGAAPGCAGSGAGADGADRADGAVQPLPDLGRHVVAAVDDGRRPRDRCRAPRPSPRR